MLSTPAAALPTSNPFATRFVRPGSLDYRFRNGDTEADNRARKRQMVDALMRRHFGCIVGPHGTGKSTLLHALQPELSTRFQQIASLRLSACPKGANILQRFKHAVNQGHSVHARHRQLGPGGLLVVDGLEQLSQLDIARMLGSLRMRRQYLLATCHRPIRGLSVLHRTQVDSRIASTLTRGLVAGHPLQIQQLVIDKLTRQDWSRVTNLRDFWFDLYEVVESKKQGQAPDS